VRLSSIGDDRLQFGRIGDALWVGRFLRQQSLEPGDDSVAIYPRHDRDLIRSPFLHRDSYIPNIQLFPLATCATRRFCILVDICHIPKAVI
jgi:hypothetical protein